MKSIPEAKTRHGRVREWMLREIQSHPLSSRLPSDREMAKRLKVALLTVKRAMGDLERDGYVVRRQGKGTFLVSREKSVRVRSLDSARNGKVLFAYPNYFSHEYWKRAYIAEELALKSKMGLAEFKMHPHTTYQNLIDAASAQEDVRGVIIDPVPGAITRKVFRALDGLGVPVVMFASSEFLSLGEHVYSFVPDWFKLGYLGARHLIERGHVSIGLINNEPAGQDRGLAVKGIKHAIREAGLPASALVRVKGATKAWENSMEAGYQLMGRLLGSSAARRRSSRRVTAVMLDSIAGAFGALRMLGERRMHVPDDLSLLANGEWSGQEEYLSPPLTTVRFDLREQVRTSFDLILGVKTPTSKTFLADVAVCERLSVADLQTAGATRGTGSKQGRRKR